MKLFQFPSNGKVDPNVPHVHRKRKRRSGFQFPSNGKVDPNSIEFMYVQPLNKFQFPSNGKVDPNPLMR